MRETETFHSFRLVWYSTKLQWSLTKPWRAWGPFWKEIMTVGAQTIWHDGSHLSPLTHLFNAFFLAPSLRTRPTQLIAEWVRVHRCTTLAAFITLSFWIIGCDGLAGMTDTFLRAEQLKPRSPACSGRPRSAPRQTGEGRPSVWPAGCTNTAQTGEVGIPYTPPQAWLKTIHQCWSGRGYTLEDLWSPCDYI